MPSTTEIQNVSDIFVSLLSHRDSRLARGAKLRAEMHEQLARGEKPDGYRPEWVRTSAFKLIQELQRLGLNFNESHTDDQCSIGDLIDIVTTALGHLKKRAGDDD
jgi:hypothetical protein